jgi:hypothetical protein
MKRTFHAACGVASVLCFALAGWKGVEHSGDDLAMAMGWLATSGIAAAGTATIYLRGTPLGRPGALVLGVVGFWSGLFAWLFFQRGAIPLAAAIALFAAVAAALSFRSWWSVRGG